MLGNMFCSWKLSLQDYCTSIACHIALYWQLWCTLHVHNKINIHCYSMYTVYKLYSQHLN